MENDWNKTVNATTYRLSGLSWTNQGKSEQEDMELLERLAAKHGYHLLKIDPEPTFKDDDA